MRSRRSPSRPGQQSFTILLGRAAVVGELALVGARCGCIAVKPMRRARRSRRMVGALGRGRWCSGASGARDRLRSPLCCAARMRVRLRRFASGLVGESVVSSDKSRKLPSLEEVLARINDAISDYMFSPAKTASDVGSAGDYPLHKVAIWGDVDAAEVLLAHGADINARGEDDDTPLHRALMGGHPEMVRFLLSRGADPDLKDRYGHSPRDAAFAAGIQDLFDGKPA